VWEAKFQQVFARTKEDIGTISEGGVGASQSRTASECKIGYQSGLSRVVNASVFQRLFVCHNILHVVKSVLSTPVEMSLRARQLKVLQFSQAFSQIQQNLEKPYSWKSLHLALTNC
jgi:hypothetical protein